MNFLNLFSGENKKKISLCRLLNLPVGVIKVKDVYLNSLWDNLWQFSSLYLYGIM